MIKNIIYVMIFCFLFITFSISNPSTTHACSCAYSPQPQQALQEAEAVFTGKVINVSNPFYKSSAAPVEVLFEVNRFWKNAQQSQVIVKSALSSASCGYEFELNKEYLVYAFSGTSAELETNICTRTMELGSAQEDITVLGAGKIPTEQVNLNGKFSILTLYTWAIVIIVMGIVLYMIYRRSRKSTF